MATSNILIMMLVALSTSPALGHHILSNEALTHATEQLSSQITVLTGKVEQLKDQVTELTGLAGGSEPSQRSAFLAQARFGKNQTFPKFSPLRFVKIIFNFGHDYNPVTGVFTAPAAGIYIFAFQLFPKRRMRNVMADLKKNGASVLRSRVGNVGHGNEETLTASTIQTAQAGDRFWITIIHGEGEFWGWYHTFFSGALI